MIQVSEDVQKAHAEAVKALENSYAPYSKLHVACGLKLKKPNVILTGVNVENASYGGTICAERSAVVAAVSKYSEQCGFDFIVVISDIPGEPIPPCGMCLQVLKEFVSDDFVVYLGDQKGVRKQAAFKDFLPHSFSAEMLPS